MQTTIFYCNKQEIIEEKNEQIGVLKENYNLWIDIVDPTNEEITNLENNFSLNKKALDKIIQKSKKPAVKEVDSNSKFVFYLI